MNVDNRVMTTGKTHQVSTEDRLIIFGHQCGPSRYVKLAGLSGAMAVAFAAYGAHFVSDNPNLNAERKRSMEQANKHHFLNTIGIVFSALASRYPALTSTLFSLGALLFCGPSYAYAITANRTFRAITPLGGVLSMFAWLSFIL
ncbi:hypothetical protein Mgra_00008453 [Meloidogyne graminicola]|uniref:Transmembrane protein 256 homolog n=1 Tax=Meloidogyne graminicola TaxID=189291 RepID=A0A8S9ZFU3_9BILA|nr:hypothetical protein Mgra_00008453 [Meloidogyne graminicola]